MGVAERFGASLYRARKRLGLSQEALAFAADLHRTEVGLLERGQRQPGIETLVKVASALEIRPEALLDGIAWSVARASGGGFDIAPVNADTGEASNA